MSEYLIQDSTLTNIANSIRGKTGKSDPILTENMATEIDSITGGGVNIVYGNITLLSDNPSILIPNTTGTTNLVVICQHKNPIYDENGSIGYILVTDLTKLQCGFETPPFNKGLLYCIYETRTNWKTYSQIQANNASQFSALSKITLDEIKMPQRIAGFPYRAGEYEYWLIPCEVLK